MKAAPIRIEGSTAFIACANILKFSAYAAGESFALPFRLAQSLGPVGAGPWRSGFPVWPPP